MKEEKEKESVVSKTNKSSRQARKRKLEASGALPSLCVHACVCVLACLHTCTREPQPACAVASSFENIVNILLGIKAMVGGAGTKTNNNPIDTLLHFSASSAVNKHKPWIETSYHGVITENTDVVLLDPPLVALDKDAPVPYAGRSALPWDHGGVTAG